MKTLIVFATLMLASPAFAAPLPTCPTSGAKGWLAANCVSTAAIWESAYAAAYVYYATVRGYDDNAAAGAAEAQADAAVRIYVLRHTR